MSDVKRCFLLRAAGVVERDITSRGFQFSIDQLVLDSDQETFLKIFCLNKNRGVTLTIEVDDPPAASEDDNE